MSDCRDDVNRRNGGSPLIAQRVVARGVNPFVVFDEVGNVLWISEATTAVMGWTPEDSYGRHFLEFLHPDSHQDAIETFGELQGAQQDDRRWEGPRLLVDVLGRDGERITVQISATLADDVCEPGEDPGGAMICEMGVTRGLPPLFRAIERVALGEELPAVMAELAASCRHEIPDAEIEIAWAPDGGRFAHAVATYDVGNAPTLMQRPYAEPTPWSAALDDAALTSAEDLQPWDAELAAAAAAIGAHAAWTLPIPAMAQTPTGALTIWRHKVGDARRFMYNPAERIVDLAAVAIRADQQRRALERAATTDSLTGVRNRAAVEAILELRVAEPDVFRPAVLFCDLDNFKPINDTYGHDVGDEVLAIVAQRMRATIRPSDVLGRWGGDEFVVVADSDGAAALAERLIEVISAPIALDSGAIQIGVSIGMCRDEDGSIGVTEAVRRADIAMLRAKRHGRGRFETAS